jgi:hypothetical protein
MTPDDTTPETPAALHPLANPMRSITVDVPPAVAQKLSEWHEGTLEDAVLTALRLYHGMGAQAYSQLRALAQTRETTPTKALREAIERAAAEANAPAKPNALGRPVTNQSRDASIYSTVKQGNTYAHTALLFNLSVVRVGQIVAHQRALNGEVSARSPRKSISLDPTPTPRTVEPKAPEIGTMFAALDSGMSRETAATTYSVTVEQVNKAYAVYKAALPPHPNRGDRVSAAYAGIHALEAKPDTPQGEEVLTLEVSAPDTPTPPPRRLAVIPPSMREKPTPDPSLPPLPADSTPGVSAVDFMDAFMKGEDVL